MSKTLLVAAEALRVEAEQNKYVPSKKYAKLKEALVQAALKPHEDTQEKKSGNGAGSSMNPVSPCCQTETLWILGGDQEDAAIACSTCGALMEFRAITNKEYTMTYPKAGN